MEKDQAHRALALFSNANWAAFVMAVTLLSVFNSSLSLFPFPDEAVTVLASVNVSITFILWADFFYMLRRAPDRREFWRSYYGWLAFLGSFPFLRILRVIWFWLVLKKEGKRPKDLLARISVNRDAQGTLLGVLFVVIVVFQFAVVSILAFEAPAADGNIRSVNDAFWWAFVTVSTVGYGDKYPVTQGGRIVGFALILVGIALFSVITGTLTQWFLGQRRIRHGKKSSSKQGQEAPNQQDGRSVGPKPLKETTLDEIKTLLEQQARTYQQDIDELNARLAELEARLKDRGP